MQLANAYTLQILINVFDIKVAILTCVGLVSVQSFGNYLPLNAGVLYNAGYLKLKRGLPLTQFISLTASSLVLMVFAYGLIGTILMSLNFYITNEINFIMLSVSVVFVFIGLIFLFIPLPFFKEKNSLFRWINHVQNGWRIIRNDRNVLIKIILVHTVVLILLSLRFFIIFKDLNSNIGLIGIALLTIMTTVLRFNSIFPGNLGLREAVAGGVSKSFGFSFNIGLLAGIIDRIVAMFWIFLLGIIFSFILTGGNKILVEKPK